MIRILISGAAVLALGACGTQQDGNAGAANAAANLLETLPNELADDQVSDANLANAAEPPPPAAARAAPAAEPPAARPAKAAPRAAPPRPAATEAPVPTKAQAEPDPHAGHDMDNRSSD